ncbi:Uncharacterised protein [Escherichia coli]|nr:hypothetical protein BvCmsK120A_02030 [Escherichia coli]GCI85586.1 hypothetical protein BvCmsA102A_02652 [Escherichia coli]CAD5681083.1 Uncharacterised protein [Escherichia coli]CAD6113141.1 Uncharacterised protein [Escherichia coli]
MILSGLSLWEKGSPLHKSTQQVRTQGPIRHADCRQRKLADFLCTGGIIQGLIRRASVASGAECRIVTRHLSFSGDVCLDHDRRDDHDELSYGDAAVAAVRVGASDCLAIHNVVSTSRGRASDRHPSNNRDYHDRLSVILLTGLT